MIEEIWKDVPRYEGLYQVSNLGRVKTLHYHRGNKEKILSPGLRCGYLLVNLCKNGKVKQYSVHRLVAEAFIENPENLPIINHKDEDKTNNSIFNLEWCDNTYNIRYSTARKVGCYKDGKLIKVYDAVIDVTKDGFNDGNVCSVLKRKRNSAGGYQWKYLE